MSSSSQFQNGLNRIQLWWWYLIKISTTHLFILYRTVNDKLCIFQILHTDLQTIVPWELTIVIIKPHVAIRRLDILVSAKLDGQAMG